MVRGDDERICSGESTIFYIPTYLPSSIIRDITLPIALMETRSSSSKL